jgi:transcriptional regulator EpsA
MDTITVHHAPTVQRSDSLLGLFQGALSARSQGGWSRWLQGEVQAFLPHEALVVAWGDFRAGALAYDVIARTPAGSVDTVQSTPQNVMEPLMVALFHKWLEADQEPVAVGPGDLHATSHSLFSIAPVALVHGIQDHRTNYDCIYVFMGTQEIASAASREVCAMVLPFIDTGFRQMPNRGRQRAEWDLPRHRVPRFSDTGPVEAGEKGSALSARELEIMQWVRIGKTNSEIAMILNLSTFTVKNHMRRIYRKLDVLNRAQAVGSLDRMQGVMQFAGR